MKRATTLALVLALLLGMACPALGAAALPPSFVPQTAAEYFNNLMGPVLEMLGEPNPVDVMERFALTQAQTDGNILYISNAGHEVELSALFRDGAPAADGVASTLGIGIASGVERSDAVMLTATFALLITDTDEAAGDFTALVDWMVNALDSGTTQIKPMNGYMLMYVKNANGDLFSLVSNAVHDGGLDGGDAPGGAGGGFGGGGSDIIAPDAAPAQTEAPTPEPTPEPTPTPKPTDTPEPLPEKLKDAVLEWNGLWVKPVKFSTHVYGDTDASLWLHFRVLNNSDEALRLYYEDITIDGVEASDGFIGEYAPHTDTGKDPSDFMLVMADRDGKKASASVIANAQKVKLTLVVKDGNYNRLCSEKVTIKLDKLKGERDEVPASLSKGSGKGKSETGGYRSLSKGDKGDDVKRLQQKLIDLGWLNDVADGEFGSKTAAAVKAFNEASGLGASGTASVQTQEALFSPSAQVYTEPWIPVEVPYTQWDDITGEGASYRVKLTNTSKTRTIKGIDLHYYVTDVWGNRLWGSTIHREATFTMTIKPGQTKYSTWFYMSPSWYSIDMIHFRVARVAFDDGTVHENDSDDYNWTVTLH